jgi:hypothetical protein
MALIAFCFSFRFGFVFDDHPQVVDDPYIVSWDWFPEYFKHPLALNYYRPIFMAWFLLNRMLFGLNPVGWHSSLIVLHVCVSVLAYFLAEKITRSRSIGFLAACTFAVHAVHIESVSWVSGGTDPLMAAFMLGSFLIFFRWREREHDLIAFAGSLCLAIAGMLVKETGVVMPALIATHALLFPRNSSSRWIGAIRETLPFALVAGLYLVIRSVVLAGFAHPVVDISNRQMVLTIPSVLSLYIKHLLWPSGLSIYYDLRPVDSAASPGFLWPLLFLFLTVAVCLLLMRLLGHRLVLLALAWTFIPIVPVLYLPAFNAGDFAHDRYLYLSSLGICLLIAMVIHSLPAGSVEIFGAPWIRAVVSVAVISTLTIATWSQQLYYENDLKLNYRAVKIAPNSDSALVNLGVYLGREGRFDEAFQAYLSALNNNPNNWFAHFNLGVLLFQTGHIHESRPALDAAARINPLYGPIFAYLAQVELQDARDPDRALALAMKAIQLEPRKADMYVSLGTIYEAKNDLENAEKAYRQSLKIDPAQADAIKKLQVLQSKKKQRP